MRLPGFTLLLSFIISGAICQQLTVKSPVKYLALGDSYTIGQSVSPQDRWPTRLIQTLLARGAVASAPQYIALTGWRTDNLKNAIEGASLTNTYSLVSLLIGVNNYYQGRSVESYKPEFRELLLRAIELAQGDASAVFVLSIPDYGFTPFGQSSQPTISVGIDLFNSANLEIATELGVNYFDITDISRRGLDQPELVASDGLHPSAAMYSEWVDRINGRIVIVGEVEEPVTAVDEAQDGMLHVYPNPAASTVFIEGPSNGKTVTVKFWNSYGIASLDVTIISNDIFSVVDLTSLSSGIYFYEVSDGGRFFARGKLQKQ